MRIYAISTKRTYGFFNRRYVLRLRKMCVRKTYPILISIVFILIFKKKH